MTIEQVLEAKQALEAEGLRPSFNAVRARAGGSKRDIARLMRQLTGTTMAR